MCDQEKYINIQTGEEIDWENVNKLPDNAMLKHSSHLFNEWDFEKNNELGLDIYKVTKGMGKRAWWICTKCESSYDTRIADRVKYGCAYCSNLKINHTNSLTSLNPELASQWHQSNNGDLTVNDVGIGSSKKVWWQCNNYEDHEWEAKISDRNNGSGCPYCSAYKPKLLKGFNDMWTTNPELASQLVNPEDGYKYMKGGSQKLKWRCECGNTVSNKVTYSIKNNIVKCPKCSDSSSYAEKFLYNVLINFTDDFITEKTFTWSDKKRYDFYLPSYNMIIEVHGKQHYIESISSLSGVTLAEEQENDRLKEQLATSNGVKEYIVIDARKGEKDFIMNSIINSKLVAYFDIKELDISSINSASNKNIHKKIIELHNQGFDRFEIALRTKLKPASIRKIIYKYRKEENNAKIY